MQAKVSTLSHRHTKTRTSVMLGNAKASAPGTGARLTTRRSCPPKGETRAVGKRTVRRGPRRRPNRKVQVVKARGGEVRMQEVLT